MIASHIHDALRQVRELRQRVLDSQRFTGYSGRARAFGGCLALAAAWIMSRPFYPRTDRAHLAGWLATLTCGVIVNYSAVGYWFLFNPRVNRNLQRLAPTMDPLPSLITAGILGLALIQRGAYSALLGAWMCLFGLTNLSSRRFLPKAILLLGWYYILCGAVCLLTPGLDRSSPSHFTDNRLNL